MSICLLFLITFIPVNTVFADNNFNVNDSQHNIVSKDSSLEFTPNQITNDKLRISVDGSGGTANLNYMSNGKYLSWRITSKTGVMSASSFEITIMNSKVTPIAMYPLMGAPGVTKVEL